MSLHQFLTFNNQCPLCNNPLTLYMQWIDSFLFMATEFKSGTYSFNKYFPNGFGTYLNKEEDSDSEDFMVLNDYGDKFDTSFSNPSLFREAKKYKIYFYYLCRATGLQSNNLIDYEINLAKGCYYRSSMELEFKNNESGDWKLYYLDEEFSDIVNKDESFCLKYRKEKTDKFYLLSRDLEKQITTVWYYTITDEDRKDPKFKPNLFEKEIPLIGRPDFKNKNNIIQRIENWILLS